MTFARVPPTALLGQLTPRHGTAAPALSALTIAMERLGLSYHARQVTASAPHPPNQATSARRTHSALAMRLPRTMQMAYHSGLTSLQAQPVAITAEISKRAPPLSLLASQTIA